MQNPSHAPNETTGTSTYADLLRQRKELDAKLNSLREDAINGFRERVLAEAQALEVEILTLFTPPAKTKTRQQRTPPTKYQNPENPAETYGGKGPKPQWLQEKLDAGADLADFRVVS